MTIGHEIDPIQSLSDWINSRGLMPTWTDILLVATPNSKRHISIILHFLCKPSIQKIFEHWGEYDSISNNLFLLSKSISNEKSLLFDFHEIQQSKQIVNQFRGEIADRELLFMMAVRRPSSNNDINLQFDLLRCWILVKAIFIYQTNGYRDEFIEISSSKTRLAGDGSEIWLNEILSFKFFGETHESQSRQIRWKSRISSKSEGGKESIFLKSLSRLAHGESKPLKLTTKSNNYLFSKFLSEAQETVQANEVDSTLPDWDALESPDEIIQVSPLLGATVVPIDPNASSGRQQLSGRSVLLRSAEQLQFLKWSWDKPNPAEAVKLLQFVSFLRLKEDPASHLLALLIQAACLTSRSLRLVQLLPVSDDSGPDWAISHDFTFLHKNSPRRNPGWKTKSHQLQWLQPLSKTIRLQLSSTPKEIPKRIEVVTLSDLWEKLEPDRSPEIVFNKLVSNDAFLSRLSSGLLSSWLSQQIFDASLDSVLAQVVSSSPRTGLAGNCAYASWSATKVKASLPVLVDFSDQDLPNLNAVGSQLDPLDEALHQVISDAHQRISLLSAQPKDWIAHHNSLTLYIVMALFACTGARPIRDPFESPSLFDWESKRVFLDDKRSAGHSGRLLPLVDAVADLVINTYCKHLQWLAVQVTPWSPQMAAEIALLANLKDSKHLPFFFLLSDSPCLHWESVSEHSIEQAEVFTWPLPANLMRHRLSIRLRTAGLDAEIIDSLLGHSDQGVATHDLNSPRIWNEDMKSTLPHLQDVFSKLGFQSQVALSSWKDLPKPTVDEGQTLATHKLFGSAARSERRSLDLQRQLRKAHDEIQAFLNGRKPETIAAEEWDKIAIQMLTLDGKRPHPFGAQRYRLLQKLQGRFSRKVALKVKRVFVTEATSDSPFTSSAIGCEDKVHQLKDWFETIASTAISTLGTRKCLMLAAIDVVLTSRVPSMRLVDAILVKKNIRVVMLDYSWYLEHHPLLDEDHNAPVIRHRISNRCMAWLNQAHESKIAMDPKTFIFPSNWAVTLPEFAKIGKRPFTSWLENISALVHQLNVIELPGLIAGYRSGHISTSALPHRAWLLNTQNLVMSESVSNHTFAPEEEQDAAATEVDGPVEDALMKVAPRLRLANTKRASDRTESVLSARETLTALRKQLSNYKNEDAGVDMIRNRRDLTVQLQSVIDVQSPFISSGIWVLGAWLIHLVKTPYRPKEYYAVSTIKRYLDALAQRFVEMGHDFDLIGSDGDEITDFYDEVLEFNRDLDLQYVSGRLRAFHRFAQENHEVDEVDWGELDCGSDVAHGSPGTVGHQQYLNALELLVGPSVDADDINLAAAMLLVLAYRFGLRSAEAHGLLAQDWRDHENIVVLRVQSNQLHKLKRACSRRLVPQTEQLTDLEKQILNAFFQLFAHQRLHDPSFPLFANQTKGSRHDLAELRQRVNDTLKRVHLDPTITIHKARHAYANRMAEGLMSSAIAPNHNKTQDTEQESWPSHLKKLLLGTTNVTRRAPWALCRLMGHWRPATSFKSYVHQLPDWSDQWNAPELARLNQQFKFRGLDSCSINIKHDAVQWHPIAYTPIVEEDQQPITMQRIGRYFDLLRHHSSKLASCRSCKISPELGDTIEQSIKEISDRLNARTMRKGRDTLDSILLHVNNTEWALIVKRCQEPSTDITPAMSTEFSVNAALSMVAVNRQILMWKQEHFDWVDSFTRHLALTHSDIRLFCSSNYPMLCNWKTTSQLSRFEQDTSGTLAKSPQIDSIYVGDPPVQIKHRCAILVSAGKDKQLTGFGLVLMWLIYAVTRQAESDRLHASSNHTERFFTH